MTAAGNTAHSRGLQRHDEIEGPMELLGIIIWGLLGAIALCGAYLLARMGLREIEHWSSWGRRGPRWAWACVIIATLVVIVVVVQFSQAIGVVR